MKKTLVALIGVLSIVAAVVQPATAGAAPGSPDAGFRSTVPGFDDVVGAFAVQPDGKILVGGEFTTYQGQAAPYLIRLNHDGSRDTTFQQTGTGLDATVSSIALLPDGRMYVGGYFAQYDGQAARYLIRLNPDGSRDTTFQQPTNGLDGIVRTVLALPDGSVLAGGDFTHYALQSASRLIRIDKDGKRDTSFTTGTGFDAAVVSLCRQKDGKILVGGSFNEYNKKPAAYLARLNADGSRDTGFALEGTGFDSTVSALAVDGDGLIMAGGWFQKYDSKSAAALLRLQPDGSRDASFKQTGSGLDDVVHSLVVRPDGDIVVGGEFTTYNGGAAAHLARFNTKGTPSPGFAADGTRLTRAVYALAALGDGTFLTGGYLAHFTADGRQDTQFGRMGLDGNVATMALQPDGKILIGGYFSHYNAVGSQYLMRLGTDGSPDLSFGKTGTPNYGVEAIAVQPDGKILVGGAFDYYALNPGRYLIRLNPDGSRDNTFTQTGTGLDDVVRAIAVQPDGKILVGGDFTHYATRQAHNLIRFNPDGTRDETFNQDGTGLNGAVRAITLQSDGRILVGGAFKSYNSEYGSQYITRLTSDGSHDPTFVQPGTGLHGTISSLAVRSDGRIMIGGEFTAFDLTPVQYLARLRSDGDLDPTFVQSGAGLNGPVSDVLIQPDGKVLAGGNFQNYDGLPAAGLIRLNPEGSRDKTFAQFGTGFNEPVAALLAQSDGKILVGGDFTGYGGHDFTRVGRLVGGPSTLSASPKSLSFGDQPVGTPSTPRRVTVTNTGHATATIDAVKANDGRFAITSQTCSRAELLPSATCTVDVRFTPNGAGTVDTTLSIASDAAGSPLSVAVSGNGIAKPAKPGGLKVKATTSKVKSRWKASAGASGYTLTLTGKTAMKKKAKKTRSLTTTSTTIKVKLKKGTKVTVCVTANNAAGASAKGCAKAKVR